MYIYMPVWHCLHFTISMYSRKQGLLCVPINGTMFFSHFFILDKLVQNAGWILNKHVSWFGGRTFSWLIGVYIFIYEYYHGWSYMRMPTYDYSAPIHLSIWFIFRYVSCKCTVVCSYGGRLSTVMCLVEYYTVIHIHLENMIYPILSHTLPVVE